MKYIFLFCGTTYDQQRFDSLSPDELRAQYAKVGDWFGRYSSRIKGGEQLQGPDTATTITRDGQGAVMVKDGPFIEGKEIIGGYAEVEVDDLDQAIQMAKEWPAGPVEIRPIVARMQAPVG
jgi:hypothetical protein